MGARIRLATAADAGAVAAIYRPSVDGSVASFETVAPDAHEMARRIEGTRPAFPWLVCVIDGTVAGYAYGGRHRDRAAYRWSVEVSVYIDATFHRRGVGWGLYESLFAILAAQGYVTAFAGVTLPNAASVGLHEAMGFEPIGAFRRIGYKYGGWHDVGWWQLALRPYEATPDEPIGLPALQRRPDFASLLATGEPRIRAG
jgi:phosphinothricin acetyltransferase